jgi:L-ascorbate metabolism protein UlaG (beta-lactamase superfamily)
MTEPATLTLTFLGTTTVYITDGTTHLLTDGFFSRPPLRQVMFGRLTPDPGTIAACLLRAGIPRLDAVLVCHSHYDHSLDCAEVCRQTGAVLVGSTSTLQVGRGAGMSESELRAVTPGCEFTFGDFTACFYPLVPPQPAFAYKDGGVYTLLLKHPQANILLQTSAASLPGALDGVKTDLALLAVGGLGRQSQSNRLRYVDELVMQTGAKWLLPLHHDDFTRPLQAKFHPLQSWLDDTRCSLAWLKHMADQNGIQLIDWQAWQCVEIPQLVTKDRYNRANPHP